MEKLMRTSTPRTVCYKEREEEQMEKYKIALGNLDKGHMMAISSGNVSGCFSSHLQVTRSHQQP
jgi:hypothetical protein